MVSNRPVSQRESVLWMTERYAHGYRSTSAAHHKFDVTSTSEIFPRLVGSELMAREA